MAWVWFPGNKWLTVVVAEVRALCLNVGDVARVPTRNSGGHRRGRANARDEGVGRRRWTRSGVSTPREIELIAVDVTGVKINGGKKVAPQILWDLRIRNRRLDDSCL